MSETPTTEILTPATEEIKTNAPAPALAGKLHDHNAVMNSISILQQHFSALSSAVQNGHALTAAQSEQIAVANKCRWVEIGVGNWLYVCAA